MQRCQLSCHTLYGQDTKFTVPFLFFILYGYGFLSWGFTDRREILHAVQRDLGQVFSHWGIAPGMAEFWALTGAIWRDMLLAEALL